MPSFNLVDEKWIPCLMAPDGKPQELGIKDTLVRAHEIREIFDPSPLVTIALHRLLLAILHRNFGPVNLDAWHVLWGRGQWDAQTLCAYLAECHPTFDLFDPQRPFFQVPEMSDAENHSTANLAQEMAAGNNATLFDHSCDATAKTMLPAEAARYLLARQAFSIGFGKSNPFYFQDAPLVRGFTVLATGETLFQTLALNLMVCNSERPLPSSSTDKPTWEYANLKIPDKGGTQPDGYMDYLTWQSRRVHLVTRGEGSVVVQCQVQQNMALADGILDPFMCFISDPETGIHPRNLSATRALWRDSHVLFQEVDHSWKRPEVFNWLARIHGLQRQGEIDLACQVSFSVYGFATEKGKAASVILWRHERLPLPLPYLGEDATELLNSLKDGLTLAENVGKQLNQACRRLAQLVLFPNKGENGGLTKPQSQEAEKFLDALGPGSLYWSHLEAAFRELLVALPDDKQEQDGIVQYGITQLRVWKDVLRRAARGAFDEVANGLDRDARTLKAVSRAERLFNARLREILGPAENERRDATYERT